MLAISQTRIKQIIESDKRFHGTDQCGEKCHFAKLTEQDVLKIRADYEVNKQQYKEIAAQYGVSVTAVYKIIRRKRWTHI